MKTFLIAVIVLSVSDIVCYFIKKRTDKKLDKFVKEFHEENCRRKKQAAGSSVKEKP